MTVSALIAILAKLPPDAPVVKVGSANLLFEIESAEAITDIVVGSGDEEIECVLIQ